MHIKDKNIHVEAKENAFQSNVLEHIGKASEVKIQPAEDFIFSGVKIGYPDVTIEDVNGRDEFNVTQHWTGPITRSTKVLDLTSVYKASMYDIEFTRINLDGKDSTNNKNDNDVFFLHVNDVPVDSVYTLRRSHSSLDKCAAGATAFNVELSPRHCLNVHGNFLRSCYFFQSDKELKFQSTQRNADIVAHYAATPTSAAYSISEKSDLKFADQAPAYFIPLEAEISAPVSINLMNVMSESPNGVFTFIWEDSLYYGYPIEVGVKPTDRPVQETRMLLSANNDVLKLIR